MIGYTILPNAQAYPNALPSLHKSLKEGISHAAWKGTTRTAFDLGEAVIKMAHSDVSESSWDVPRFYDRLPKMRSGGVYDVSCRAQNEQELETWLQHPDRTIFAEVIGFSHDFKWLIMEKCAPADDSAWGKVDKFAKFNFSDLNTPNMGINRDGDTVMIDYAR